MMPRTTMATNNIRRMMIGITIAAGLTLAALVLIVVGEVPSEEEIDTHYDLVLS